MAEASKISDQDALDFHAQGKLEMAPIKSLTTQRDLSLAYSPIGPMLLGLEKQLQIVQMTATVNDLVQAAAIAAHAQCCPIRIFMNLNYLILFRKPRYNLTRILNYLGST